MSNNKNKFNQWSDNIKELSLFYHYTYYQALYNDNWDKDLDIRDEKTISCLPYFVRSKYGLKKMNDAINKQFNTEGSMLKPVKKKFKAFDGTQTPYFGIQKINSPLLKLLKR